MGWHVGHVGMGDLAGPRMVCNYSNSDGYFTFACRLAADAPVMNNGHVTTTSGTYLFDGGPSGGDGQIVGYRLNTGGGTPGTVLSITLEKTTEDFTATDHAPTLNNTNAPGAYPPMPDAF